MIRLSLILLGIGISLLLTSCFKEDERVTPHVPGTTEIDTIPMTNLYKYQVYYKLSTGEAALSVDRKLWDIAFESGAGGWHIRLNTGCFMYAAELAKEEFGIPVDSTGAVWKFDTSNGNADSTAIGIWYTVSGTDTNSKQNLYLINRGIDEQGNDRGYRQFIVDSLRNDTWYFRIADFNGTNAHSYAIHKDASLNYVQFSFTDPASQPAEPLKESWDLLFTQYTTLLYTDLGEPYPYLVTGVLLNPNLVEVARDTVSSFESITFESVQDLEFSKQQDFIGYHWKYYNFDTGAYTVDPAQIYIIRDVNGLLFKLRFLGFYNNKGEKGFPSIEYQQL